MAQKPSRTRQSSNSPRPVYCIAASERGGEHLNQLQKNWLSANRFEGRLGHLLPLPDKQGDISAFAFGMGDENQETPLKLGLASAALPAGAYELKGYVTEPEMAALAFRLGAYRFQKYHEKTPPVTLSENQPQSDETRALVEAAYIARDLINTPANDLGPEAFEKEIRAFARKRKMTCSAIVGDKLLKQNFPLIHAVGRASTQAPRLLDLRWGKKDAPKVTLVGKGVTFDTGGLSIKPTAGMVLMKKDMGGAANILGLASAIVAGNLKVQLRVLIPVVENAIAGNAFRPGDILPSRNGMSVEIGNTDAEGRLILADALSCASEESPEILIDMATLTGAARVALGPDLPPLYSSDDALARQLMDLGKKWGDPLWHMPLWQPYDANLSSSVADVNHISSGGFAGSITAALFLRRFVKNTDHWVHLDIYGWMPKPQPGRPDGGTDQGIRAAYMMLKQRYA